MIFQRDLFSVTTLLKRTLIKFVHSKSFRSSLISVKQNQVSWNFKYLDSQSCKVDCLIINNNKDFNQKWLSKIASQTQSILLADGGANIFRQFNLNRSESDFSKVQAIIGDLDSLQPEVQRFYQNRNVPIQKDISQQKNDFEKTIEYGINLGYKNIIVSGAFGDRLDHTFGTMSIAQRIVNSHPQVNLVLTNKSSIYCLLRTGFKHTMILSKLIDPVGCGLLTFQRINGIKTSGFKWNLGKQYLHDSIEWGKYLSTSNEIQNKADNVIVIESKKQSGLINFVANFKQM